MKADITFVTDPITTGDASKILDCSPRRVQQLEAARILIAIRTPGGQRLFSREQVKAVRRLRDETRRKR